MKEGEERTAIITKVVVGHVDHYTEIMMSCTFNMDGLGCTLSFSIPQAKVMMKDARVYDDIQALTGKPCQVKGAWGRSCKFVRMWKG